MASPVRRMIQMTRSTGLDGFTEFVRHGLGWRWRRLRSRLIPAARAGNQMDSAVVRSEVSLGPAEERLSLIAANDRELLDGAPSPDLPVAVIIPTFRDSDFLAAALQSVANQTHKRWRCYVVDDASPEAVDDVFKRYADDDRFVLLRHGANAGLAAARNTGARFATEPLLQFLDADDLLTPWSIEKRVAVFRDHWTDEFVGGVYGQIYQCTEETRLEDLDTWTAKENVGIVDWLSSDGDCPFNVHAPLVRRSAFVGVGGFDEEFLNGAEDWELWQRMLRHGFVFRGSAEVAGAYRQRRASMVREHASVHVGRAAELLNRANQSAELRDDLPMPYRKPIGALREDYRRTKRAAIYAGITCAQGGSIDEATESVAPLLDGTVVIPTRAREFAGSARAGMVRGLGLAPSSVAALDKTASKVLDNAAIEISLGFLAGNPAADRGELAECDMTNRVSYDIALIAEHAGDVDVLERVAAEVERQGLSVVALDIEPHDAAQGANDRWRSLGRTLVPYNALCLGACSVRALVGRRPGGPVTWSTLSAVDKNGGLAIVVDDDNGAITIPDSPPSTELANIKTADAAEISQLVAGAASWSLPDLLAPRESNSGKPDVAEVAPEARLGSGFVALLPREEFRIDDPSMEKLQALRNAHKGDTAVIIGNGPSLNDTDLDLLTGVATFGVNSIFLADDRLPEPLHYYVVEDSAVMNDNTEAIKSYEAQQKLFPTNYLRYFKDAPIPENTAFFRMNGGFYDRGTGTFCLPRFSTNAAQRVFCGQSVTIINLQLAYWMGFDTVALIGMDFSYQIPDDAEINGELIVSRSDDPNHFHPDYFGAGKTWKDPHLDRVLASYRLAKQIYETDGKRIVNATAGGALEEFERASLESVLR